MQSAANASDPEILELSQSEPPPPASVVSSEPAPPLPVNYIPPSTGQASEIATLVPNALRRGDSLGDFLPTKDDDGLVANSAGQIHAGFTSPRVYDPSIIPIAQAPNNVDSLSLLTDRIPVAYRAHHHGKSLIGRSIEIGKRSIYESNASVRPTSSSFPCYPICRRSEK